MSTPSPHVVELTAANFQAEALDRSTEVPVVVDFWATWCAPCRTLGPLLEKLAAEFQGRFVLGKAETEALPEVATAFGVRSIPAVYALRDGRVVDSFVGALPESAVRAWLNKILPSEADRLTTGAKAAEETDPAAAEADYRAALDLEPKHQGAALGLARLLLRQGKPEEAAALVARLEARGFLEPEAEALKAELHLRGLAASTGGVEAARKAAEADPSDPSLKLKLAESLAASGAYRDALEAALELVENHRKDLGDAPRLVMLDVFRLLPEGSDLAAEYRRKLSAALY